MVTIQVLETPGWICEVRVWLKRMPQNRVSPRIAFEMILRTADGGAYRGRRGAILITRQSSKRTTKVVKRSEECNWAANWRAASWVRKLPTRTR